MFKQFNEVGETYSSILVNEGITTIDKLLEMTPIQLDKKLKTNSLGQWLLNSAKKLPRFDIVFKKVNHVENTLEVKCVLQNIDEIRECGDGCTLGLFNPIMFILGDMNNNLLFNESFK
jgi:hypothetical protein